ncbi:HNH endonuclease family protein [Parasphingorhabdus pacifica]
MTTRQNNKKAPVWTSVLAAVLLGGGWLLFESGWLDSWLSGSDSGSPPASSGAAGDHLGELSVAPAGSMDGYSRDAFDHWVSQPSAGKNCNTREAVLKRDGDGVAVDGACEATSGSWVSDYTGETLTDDSKLDIDHMVPLANAWRSGANEWSDERREQFANDMQRPQLLAVDAGSNRSKGDQGPAEWQPEIELCAYATDWITVKHEYELSITSAEKTALENMLAGCA